LRPAAQAGPAAFSHAFGVQHAGYRLPRTAEPCPKENQMSQQAIASTEGAPTSLDETEITAPRKTLSLGQLLAAMTFDERVRAYKNRVFTRAELAAAIAREPECLPTINGEFEWIGASLADNLD
jgi:hypothetical protein